MTTAELRPDLMHRLQAAVDHHKAGRFAEAGNLYLHVLAEDPGNPAAQHMLGVVLFAAEQLERALHMLLQARAQQPDNAEVHSNLGSVLHQSGRLEEALASFDRALEITPEFAVALSNRGLVLQEMRRFAQALDSFARAIAADPAFTDVLWHMALTRLQQGEFRQGWADYEWRWQTALRPAPGTEGPRWEGHQDIAGRTVLLHAEQGYGDTLQFCRYAPLVGAMGARVVLAVQKPLVRLLASLPAVAEVVDLAGPLPPFDLQCPLLSLPFALGTELGTIPGDIGYLRPDPRQVLAWQSRLSTLKGRRIGLVWSGAPRPELAYANRVDRRRSMRLAQLAPLATVAGVRYLSLQKGPPAAELTRAPAGLDLIDWTDALDDFADTAALVAGLDLLITVDTAMAHLAGALGISVWVMNRYDSCWRWLHDREDTPWYPTMRLFTQTTPGDWVGVVDRVVAALVHAGPMNE